MAGSADILKGLSEILEPDQIKSDPATLSRYSADGAKPRAVVFPTRVEQVSQVVRYANQEKLALLPGEAAPK